MQYLKDLHQLADFDHMVEDSQEPMVLLNLDNPYHLKLNQAALALTRLSQHLNLRGLHQLISNVVKAHHDELLEGRHLVTEHPMGEKCLHLRCHPVTDTHLMILELSSH